MLTVSFLTSSFSNSLFAQTNYYYGTTGISGSGITLKSNGYETPWISNSAYFPTRYEKCNYASNSLSYARPLVPTGFYVYVQGAKRVRIEYELLNGNTVLFTSNYESYDYEMPSAVTGTNINNLGNNVFSSYPVNGQDYHFRITVRAGKKNGLFSGWSWPTVLAEFETLPSEVNYVDATPDFTLTSPFTNDPSGRPIVCINDIKIDGSASNCETVFYLEVAECDEWGNHNPVLGADYAGAWFNMQVPQAINLQLFTAVYGNPLNGNPLMGTLPTAYAGFLMRQRAYPDPGTGPNYYRIKLVTFQNGWKEKTMFIDVIGSCKTGKTDGTNVAFDPTTMPPMSQEELSQLFAERGKPIAIDAVKTDDLEQRAERRVLLLYPNPAKNEVRIESTDAIVQYKAEVTDVYGNSYPCASVLQNENTISLQVSSLKSGLYIVTTYINNKIYQDKLWIE